MTDLTQTTTPFKTGSIVQMADGSIMAILTHKFCKVIAIEKYEFIGIIDWCYRLQPVKLDEYTGEVCWTSPTITQMVPHCDIKCTIQI